jgi:hypothetical protein
MMQLGWKKGGPVTLCVSKNCNSSFNFHVTSHGTHSTERSLEQVNPDHVNKAKEIIKKRNTESGRKMLR